MQKAVIMKKAQAFYKLGMRGGIIWGIAVAMVDLMMRGSPIGQVYMGLVESVTTPLYAQIDEWTSNSPVLLSLANSMISAVYLLIGYGVKITSSALSGIWGVLLQKLGELK